MAKTEEIKVIQYNCGYGWDDESYYSKSEYAQIKNDLAEYRLAAASCGGCYRVITRRVQKH